MHRKGEQCKEHVLGQTGQAVHDLQDQMTVKMTR